MLRVRGGDDETLTRALDASRPVARSRCSRDERAPLALSWAGARASAAGGLPAWLAVARARSADELLAALERVGEPALAVVYADADGAAGMQVAGWIPRRALSTGLVPLPGRARWYDWQGPVDFAQLPRERLAAGRGWAIAADNAFPRGRGGAAAEWLWRTGERAQRIDALLREATAAGPLELRQVVELQGDVGEPRARSLIASALVLAERGERLPPEANELIGLLREWDGRSTPDSVGAAAYHVFLSCLTSELFERHLGEDLTRRYLALPFVDPGQVVFGIVHAAAERRRRRRLGGPRGGGRGGAREPARGLAAALLPARLESPQVALGRPARAALPSLRPGRAARRGARGARPLRGGRQRQHDQHRGVHGGRRLRRARRLDLPLRDRHRRDGPGAGRARAGPVRAPPPSASAATGSSAGARGAPSLLATSPLLVEELSTLAARARAGGRALGGAGRSLRRGAVLLRQRGAGRRARAGEPSGDRGRRSAQARAGAGGDAGRARRGRARRHADARGARAAVRRARAVRTNMARYRDASRRLFACLRREVEKLEAGGSRRASTPTPAGFRPAPDAIAAAWVTRVRDELGLPLRVGIARSKLLARLAAEEAGEGVRRVALGAGGGLPAPAPGDAARGRRPEDREHARRARRAHDRRGGRARARAARGALRNAWPAHPRRGDRRRRSAGARGAPPAEPLAGGDARGRALRPRRAGRASAAALAPARGRAARPGPLGAPGDAQDPLRGPGHHHPQPGALDPAGERRGDPRRGPAPAGTGPGAASGRSAASASSSRSSLPSAIPSGNSGSSRPAADDFSPLALKRRSAAGRRRDGTPCVRTPGKRDGLAEGSRIDASTGASRPTR